MSQLFTLLPRPSPPHIAGRHRHTSPVHPRLEDRIARPSSVDVTHWTLFLLMNPQIADLVRSLPRSRPSSCVAEKGVEEGALVVRRVLTCLIFLHCFRVLLPVPVSTRPSTASSQRGVAPLIALLGDASSSLFALHPFCIDKSTLGTWIG
jgi:hypothetical protein